MSFRPLVLVLLGATSASLVACSSPEPKVGECRLYSRDQAHATLVCQEASGTTERPITFADTKADAGADGIDGTSCAYVGEPAPGQHTIQCGDKTFTLRDGQDGDAGTDGTSCVYVPQSDPQKHVVRCGNDTFEIRDGSDGMNGANGYSGRDGERGSPGAPGRDGQDNYTTTLSNAQLTASPVTTTLTTIGCRATLLTNDARFAQRDRHGALFVNGAVKAETWTASVSLDKATAWFSVPSNTLHVGDKVQCKIWVYAGNNSTGVSAIATSAEAIVEP